jgi:hypothetical protein
MDGGLGTRNELSWSMISGQIETRAQKRHQNAECTWANLSCRDLDAFAAGHFDDRARVIFEPLALPNGKRLDPTVGAGTQGPEEVRPRPARWIVELGRDDQDVHVAVRPPFPSRPGPEDNRPARRDPGGPYRLEVVAHGPYNCRVHTPERDSLIIIEHIALNVNPYEGHHMDGKTFVLEVTCPG